MFKKKNKIAHRIIWSLLIAFCFINIIAIFHSYKFTHFSISETVKTQEPKTLSFVQKISVLLMGVNNIRPQNKIIPNGDFKVFNLESNKRIECWEFTVKKAKGTVILFHGYGGQKSSLLQQSDEFRIQGYNTVLVDFMGSGGSEGNQTTIGFKEAEQVKTCYDYLLKKGEKNIYLYGISMGAVAIMRAVSVLEIHPKGIILECPFGSMYKTVCARFKTMNLPTFPMASLLVFWGGTENGFWAFGHNPVDYANHIHCPTLLFYGAKDEKVSAEEINEIYSNLKGRKKLLVFENAGHENYLIKYKLKWRNEVESFLKIK